MDVCEDDPSNKDSIAVDGIARPAGGGSWLARRDGRFCSSSTVRRSLSPSSDGMYLSASGGEESSKYVVEVRAPDQLLLIVRGLQ